MGELSGTEDFDEEQAYAERLGQAIETGGVCKCGMPTIHLPKQHEDAHVNEHLKSYNDVVEQLQAARFEHDEIEVIMLDAYENGAAQTIAGLVTHDKDGYELDTSALQQHYEGDGVFADNELSIPGHRSACGPRPLP